MYKGLDSGSHEAGDPFHQASSGDGKSKFIPVPDIFPEDMAATREDIAQIADKRLQVLFDRIRKELGIPIPENIEIKLVDLPGAGPGDYLPAEGMGRGRDILRLNPQNFRERELPVEALLPALNFFGLHEVSHFIETALAHPGASIVKQAQQIIMPEFTALVSDFNRRVMIAQALNNVVFESFVDGLALGFGRTIQVVSDPNLDLEARVQRLAHGLCLSLDEPRNVPLKPIPHSQHEMPILRERFRVMGHLLLAERLGEICGAMGLSENAAALSSTADQLREKIRISFIPKEGDELDRVVERALRFGLARGEALKFSL